MPTAIAVDGNGSTYVVGTVTEGFRATADAFQRDKGQGFIAKFSAQGGVVWASRISATPVAVAVDPAGDAYVTGVAGLDFVTTPGVLKPVYEPPRCMVPPRSGSGSIPCSDGFVAKVSADGTSLIYATLLGGSLGDSASDIAVDANGSAYVVGESSSPDFPTTADAFEQRLNGGSPVVETDVFLAQLHPTGSRMIRSTFIGGTGSEWARSVVLDAERNVYVVGSTQSPDFPTTPNAFQRGFKDPGPSRMSGYGDVFFLKFSSNGPPDYISYYGGGGGLEAGGAAAVDSAGHLYFAQGIVNPSGCGAAVNIVAVDAGSGSVLASHPAYGFAFEGTSLATYAGGTVHMTGRGNTVNDPFVITPDAVVKSGEALYNRLDFSRGNEFLPVCIINAASLARYRYYSIDGTAVAPGEIFSLFGLGFTSGVKLRLGTTGIPVLYSSPTQINAAVPYSVPIGKSTLTIDNGGLSASYPIEVVPLFSGIFTRNTEPYPLVNDAIALNEDGSLNSRDNRAKQGSVITLFATGLGSLDATGIQVLIEVVPIGNPKPMEVLSAGQAPGLGVGVYQVKARIPEATYPEQVTVGILFDKPLQDSSQTARVWIER